MLTSAVHLRGARGTADNKSGHILQVKLPRRQRKKTQLLVLLFSFFVIIWMLSKICFFIPLLLIREARPAPHKCCFPLPNTAVTTPFFVPISLEILCCFGNLQNTYFANPSHHRPSAQPATSSHGLLEHLHCSDANSPLMPHSTKASFHFHVSLSQYLQTSIKTFPSTEITDVVPKCLHSYSHRAVRYNYWYPMSRNYLS